MITSVRLCLLFGIEMRFYRFSSLLIAMKVCIIVTDVVMMLLVPAKNVMSRVIIALFMA